MLLCIIVINIFYNCHTVNSKRFFSGNVKTECTLSSLNNELIHLFPSQGLITYVTHLLFFMGTTPPL